MSTDNLLVGPLCVTYKSGSMMAVAEIKVIVQTQHIGNRMYNNFQTINNECRQTTVGIDFVMSTTEISIPQVK
jgi:hypothetical protein